MKDVIQLLEQNLEYHSTLDCRGDFLNKLQMD